MVIVMSSVTNAEIKKPITKGVVTIDQSSNLSQVKLVDARLQNRISFFSALYNASEVTRVFGLSTQLVKAVGYGVQSGLSFAALPFCFTSDLYEIPACLADKASDGSDAAGQAIYFVLSAAAIHLGMVAISRFFGKAGNEYQRQQEVLDQDA